MGKKAKSTIALVEIIVIAILCSCGQAVTYSAPKSVPEPASSDSSFDYKVLPPYKIPAVLSESTSEDADENVPTELDVTYEVTRTVDGQVTEIVDSPVETPETTTSPAPTAAPAPTATPTAAPSASGPADVKGEGCYVGTLSIPSVGLSVNGYYTTTTGNEATSAAIADRTNSANVLFGVPGDGATCIVADHYSQGFAVISTLAAGTPVSISTPYGTYNYTVSYVTTGYGGYCNELAAYDIEDNDYNSVENSIPGGLILVTCAGDEPGAVYLVYCSSC